MLNKVLIQGNVTREPEVRYTANGTAIASFGFAWNQPGDRNKDSVHFYDVVVMGKTAEFVGKHVNKGTGLIVDGELRQNRWQDKETGGNRSRHEIFVGFGGSINFSGGPRRDNETVTAAATNENESPPTGNGEDGNLF